MILNVNLFYNRNNDSDFEISKVSIPWAKSRIDRQRDGVWVKMPLEGESCIDDLTCVGVHIPYLRSHTEIKIYNQIIVMHQKFIVYASNMHLQGVRCTASDTNFIATKNHYVRSVLDCHMIVSRSSQVTNITPASVFIFGNYR